MTSRIADAAGALWPKTSKRCRACQMPSLLDDVHPSCAALPTAQPAPDAAAELLKNSLGASSTPPIRTWRISGAALTTLRDIPTRNHATCVDCLEPLSESATAHGVVRHLTCWQNSGMPS